MASQDSETPHDAVETSVDRFEHEIEELEGATGGRKWGRWVLGIIVLAGAIALLVLMPESQKSPLSSAVRGAASLDLMEPRPGKLSSPPKQFRWESVSGRQSYSFRLSVMGSQSPLIDRTVKDVSIELSAEEFAKLTPGHSYVWQVEALAKQGQKLAAGQSYFDL